MPKNLPRGNEHGRSSLTGRTLYSDKNTVDCDDPKDVREYHGSQGINHGSPSGAMLEPILEEPHISPQSPRTVGSSI